MEKTNTNIERLLQKVLREISRLRGEVGAVSELINADKIPRFCRFFTWSFIKATSGLITRQIPGIANAGTWKVIDLPPPVGISANVSCPDRILSMTSACPGRNPS